MRIAYGSDIHLEFGEIVASVFENVNADVLVLAGDVTASKCEAEDFFDIVLNNFENVIYLMGNHEHYRGQLDKTELILREMLPKEVLFLQNESIEIDGIKFLGTTLWTDFNNNSFLSKHTAKYSMSDYTQIRLHNRKLNPEDILQEHYLAKRFLNQNITEGSIVITHHLPSFQSIPTEYLSSDINGAFASELSDMMLDFKPAYWIHGHTHKGIEYECFDTKVVCNPRGYVGIEFVSNFKLKVFDVRTH